MVNFAAILLVASMAVGQAQKPGNTDGINAKIRELQLERIKTLERGVQVVTMQYKEGVLESRVVMTMQLALLDAKLDMADTVERRIGVLESQLEVAKGTRAIAMAMFEAGRVSELDVLQAKATALRIEVELLKQRRIQAEGSQKGERNN